MPLLNTVLLAFCCFFFFFLLLFGFLQASQGCVAAVWIVGSLEMDQKERTEQTPEKLSVVSPLSASGAWESEGVREAP